MIQIEDTLVEEEDIGEINTLTAGIDLENINFILDLVSTKFYSNKHGSIIREYASNMWDSHIEAGHNKPIIINIDRDVENNGYFIEFTDEGVGISPERFETIFMRWFSSSKRNTNDQIGMFGLGSKSGFAYTDILNITTTVDGITYKNILYKVNKKFKLDKLSEQYTGLPNGTTIRIDIANSEDKELFIKEARTQLCYFESVYIKNNTYTSYPVDNHYRIYEGNHFKFRSNTPFKYMHIVIGQCSYPIPNDALDISLIEIPVGLSFPIGVISVTPNREAIEVTDNTKQLILEKIELVKQELKEKFNTQNPSIEDLWEYWNRRDETPCLTFSPDYDPTIKDKLIIKGLGLKTKSVYRPLENIDMPDQPLLEYEINHIQRGIVSKSTSSIYSAYRLSLCKNMYFAPNKMDKYNNIFISTGSVITEKRKSFYDICEALNINSHRVKYQRSWYKQVSKNENGYGEGAVRVPVLGAAKLVYKYRQVMREYMMQYCKQYPSVSAQWIEDYKKEQHDNSAQILRRQNQGFFYSTWNEKRIETTIKQMELSKIIFYCDKDCSVWSHKIEAYYNLINKFYKYFTGKKKNHLRLYQFIILNPTNYKIAKNLTNLVHIEDFWNVEEFQPLYNRLYFANLYNNFYQDIRDYKIQLVSDYHYDLKLKLRDFINKYYISNISDFEEDLKSIPIKNHSCTWQIRKIKKELQAFIDKAEILKYVQFDMPEKYLKLVVKQIKTTKIKQSLYGA